MKSRAMIGLSAFFLLTSLPLFPESFTDNFIAKPASTYANHVSDLFYVLGGICAVVFILVIGAMLYFVFRFRAKKEGEEGAPIHGNTKLEIVWTAIPTIVMVILAVISTDLVIQQLTPPENTLIVKVTGYQFGFDFEYYVSDHEGTGAETQTVKNICGNPAVFVKIKSLHVKTTDSFVLPMGRNVRFLTTARDVVHSFWVPEFLIKRDMVPGLNADFWLNPNKTGDFLVRCAALCGSDHATMVAKLRVVSDSDFQTWLSQQPKQVAAN